MSDDRPTAEDLALDLKASLELARNRGKTLVTRPGAVIEAWTFPANPLTAAWGLAESLARRAMAAEGEAEQLRALLARCQDLLRGAVWGGCSCPSRHLIETQPMCDVLAAIREALDKTP